MGITLSEYLHKKELMRNYVDFRIISDCLYIKEIQFEGTGILSTSKNYILGICEGDYSDSGKFIRGKYVLIKDNIIVAQGKLTNPISAFVSDNGIFVIIEKLHGLGKEYLSSVHAFYEANKLLTKNFDNYIDYWGVSQDGEYLALSTCGCSAYDSLNHKIIFYNIKKNKQLWNKDRSFNSELFDFDTSARILTVTNKVNMQYIKYSFNGHLVT